MIMSSSEPDQMQVGDSTTTSGDRSQPSDHGRREYPKYKGVRKRKWGKWVSEIRLPNSRERIWLGSYDNPEKAARAFDAALFCLRGPRANFNFPNNPPEIAGAQSLSPQEIQQVAAKFANEHSTSPDTEPNSSTTRDHPASSSSISVGAIRVSDRNMDWSILNRLEYPNEGAVLSDYDSLYSGLLYDLELTPPVSSVDDDDDDNEFNSGGTSFLWNF